MIDVFRKSEFVPEIVEQAIRIGASVVWMQEGVIHEEAAKKARRAENTVYIYLRMINRHNRIRPISMNNESFIVCYGFCIFSFCLSH